MPHHTLHSALVPPQPPCQPHHTHKNLRTPCNLGQTHHVTTNLQQAYHENGCVNIAANWGSRAAVPGPNWWPPEDVSGRGSQALDHIRANYDPCSFDTITHTDFTRINQCLINSLAILMSVSGFVYSELPSLNGLWLISNQSVGLVACEEGFDGVGCCIGK